MTLTVTQTEAENLISNLKHVDKTVIVPDQISYPSVGMNFVEAVMRVTLVEFPFYLTHQKISAIKTLREYVPGLGLADAKYAVESPNKAIVEYIKNNRARINSVKF